MMTPEQYRKSLDDLNLNLYIRGVRKSHPYGHPAACRSRDAVAGTYEMAGMPEYEQVLIATSHITGARINRFNHISQTIDDVIKQVRLNSLFHHDNGDCFQRTRGMNALHALSITPGDIDAAEGTNHHGRFLSYLQYIQENDLTCDGSLIDPWTNEIGYIPPHRNPNADSLLHTVGETPNGAVLCGMKACGAGALSSHELIVLPTMAMTKQDERYALSFALPSDTEGLTFIIAPEDHGDMGGRNDIGTRTMGAIRDHEILCVFDNVIVPWERIFLYRAFESPEQMGNLLGLSFCFGTNSTDIQIGAKGK